jgi:hypothetical protein
MLRGSSEPGSRSQAEKIASTKSNAGEKPQSPWWPMPRTSWSAILKPPHLFPDSTARKLCVHSRSVAMMSRNSESSAKSCRGVDEIHSDEKTLCRVTVHYQDDTVSVNLSSSTSFSEFDCWVRGRFALNKKSDKIVYLDQNNEEFIPNFSGFPDGELEITVKALQASIYPRKSSMNHWSDLLTFSFIFPIASFIYLLLFLAPSSLLPNPMRYFSVFSPVLSLLGVEEALQLSLYREMVCTFISWPVPYFFVRRSLNPDFGFTISFLKFGSDSFWGAVAACALLLLRHLVKAHLPQASDF